MPPQSIADTRYIALLNVPHVIGYNNSKFEGFGYLMLPWIGMLWITHTQIGLFQYIPYSKGNYYKRRGRHLCPTRVCIVITAVLKDFLRTLSFA
jgi:hypothetical protein